MGKTFVTTVRVNIEDVATIVAYLQKENISIPNKSYAISEGFRFAAEIVRANHPSLTFDLKQSYIYLKSLGVDLSGRGAKALAEGLQFVEISSNEPSCQSPDVSLSETIEEAALRRKESDAEMLKTFSDLSNLNILEED